VTQAKQRAGTNRKCKLPVHGTNQMQSIARKEMTED
jgi:hypothetical protein